MRPLKVLLIFGMFTACQERPATQEQSPTYKIAYNVLVDQESDNYDVFIMDLDGSNAENITKLDGVEWTYFADGDRLYFISDKDTLHRNYFLYYMNPDGTGKTKFSDVRLADSWHSSRMEGKELIVKPHSTVDSAFYILNTRGEVVNKINPRFPYIGDPLFSLDGKEIVFRAAKAKFKRNEMFRDELYVMDSQGKNMRQLTTYPASDTTAKWHNYKAGPPRWNRAENFISYQSVQNGKSSLFAITPDGKKQWKLTDLQYNEGWHDWSPDGQHLAVEVWDTDRAQYHIGVMDWGTKEFKIVTDTLFQYQQAPVFVTVLPEQ